MRGPSLACMHAQIEPWIRTLWVDASPGIDCLCVSKDYLFTLLPGALLHFLERFTRTGFLMMPPSRAERYSVTLPLMPSQPSLLA